MRYESRYPQTMEPSLSLSSLSWSEDVSEKVAAARANTTTFHSKVHSKVVAHYLFPDQNF